MTALLILLIFVNLVSSAVLAGTTAMVALNICPEKDKMPKVMAMQTHHAMFDLKKDAYMKPVGIISGLSAIAILIVLGLEHRLTLTHGIVYGIGLVGFMVTVVTANKFLLPLHANILTWSTEAPPPQYAERMQAFQKVMYLRLAVSCVSMLCFEIGNIVLG
jgi:hypothetical protein